LYGEDTFKKGGRPRWPKVEEKGREAKITRASKKKGFEATERVRMQNKGPRRKRGLQEY